MIIVAPTIAAVTLAAFALALWWFVPLSPWGAVTTIAIAAVIASLVTLSLLGFFLSFLLTVQVTTWLRLLVSVRQGFSGFQLLEEKSKQSARRIRPREPIMKSLQIFRSGISPLGKNCYQLELRTDVKLVVLSEL